MQPKQAPLSTTIATGFAMFSMFFGAGNVVFPLGIGQMAKENNLYAIAGLLITAVGVPFLGLISMTLFNGNYKLFFERIGKWPGFFLSVFIMLIIGPLGATPRTIALSYSTISFYWPTISLPLFSFIACIVIFLLTFRKNNILDILGYILTPLLLLCLSWIIISGLISGPHPPESQLNAFHTFSFGLHEGFKMMDLLASFFFSSVVMNCLEKDRVPSEHKNYRHIIIMTLKASLIGATLLAVVYGGFSYVASYYALEISETPQEQLLPYLALKILGPSAGLIAIGAVALACLTTAIALVSVFAEFIHYDISNGKIPYIPSVLLTLSATFCISILSFEGIMLFLGPVLTIIYPVLILLAIINLGHKLYHWQKVKGPIIIAITLSLLWWFSHL